MASPPVSALLLAAGLLCAGAARAGDAAAPALTLREAFAETLRGNPALQSFAYKLKAQDGRAATAALAPAPELGFTAENLAGTGEARGFTATEFTLTLSRVIELGDKRQRRIAVAGAERALLEADREAQQLDLLADVLRDFIAVAADQARCALAGEAVQLAEATRRAVDARVKAARAPLAEGSRAEIALTRARLEAEAAERQAAADRQQLAAYWGEETPHFERVAADLEMLPPVDAFDALAAGLTLNPALARFLSEARLRDAELQLAVAARAPDVQLGAGIRRLQLGNDEAFVLSANLPLSFGRARTQGAITTAEAERERLALDEQAARLRLRTELFGLYSELSQARSEFEALGRTLLPQAEQALQQAEYAWQRGRYSYLEWIDAQRELLELRRQRIEAAASYHRLLAEIERLTGEPLATDPEPSR